MVALQTMQEIAAPSTPRRNKRALSRQLSDEKVVDKENMPLTRTQGSVGPKKRARVACSPVQIQSDCVSELVRAVDGKLRAVPETYPLVGRERECADLDRFLQQGLSNGPGMGKCLYVSGGPGTGKTCSVRASINQFRKRVPDTVVLEVNCMDLTQRSVQGVFQRLRDRMGCPRVPGQSLNGLAAATASSLAQLGARVVLVVDEVDQLVSRGGTRAAAGAVSLEMLFALPRLPGAPAVAIVAIANAVDLLGRASVLAPTLNCSSLLFEAYSRQQLKSIVTSRVAAVEGGEAGLKALGPIKLELRAAQVAKESGDCRQVLSLIEEAVLEANSLCVQSAPPASAPSELPTTQADTVPANLAGLAAPVVPVARRATSVIQPSRNDPLQAIQQLPLEQQILLAALATSGQEATRVSEVCSRYKELSRALHQPINLGSRSQVSSALSALEQRGLLELRSQTGPRGRGRPSVAETCVELSVSCDALRESVERASPALKRFMV